MWYVLYIYILYILCDVVFYLNLCVALTKCSQPFSFKATIIQFWDLQKKHTISIMVRYVLLILRTRRDGGMKPTAIFLRTRFKYGIPVCERERRVPLTLRQGRARAARLRPRPRCASTLHRAAIRCLHYHSLLHFLLCTFNFSYLSRVNNFFIVFIIIIQYR